MLMVAQKGKGISIFCEIRGPEGHLREKIRHRSLMILVLAKWKQTKKNKHKNDDI